MASKPSEFGQSLHVIRLVLSLGLFIVSTTTSLEECSHPVGTQSFCPDVSIDS